MRYRFIMWSVINYTVSRLKNEHRTVNYHQNNGDKGEAVSAHREAKYN